MPSALSFTIFSLGDSAIGIDFGNLIDRSVHERVMALYQYLKTCPIKGTTDIVPAYSSLTLYYDPVAFLPEINKGISVFELLKSKLTTLAEQSHENIVLPERTIKIPVCYEEGFAPDLKAMAAASGQKEEEIVALHTANIYYVYMLGFLPGFAYMGEVAEAIAMPRKQRPQAIAAGSVGIAGRQTGVYPLASPGGWQIIGRTPVSLFVKETGDTLLKPGDHVQFYPISSHEFEHH